MGRRRPTVETFPEWLRMHERRMLLGHYRGALDAPRMTTHLESRERARAWAIRASACRRMRLRNETEEAWSIAFRLSPDDPWILSRYAVWQLDQGRFAEGLRSADDGLQNAAPEDRPDALCVRAQALWLCGHRQESLSDFTAAARQAAVNSPTQLASIVNIAVVLANAPDITPKSAELVLDLASHLRSVVGNRKLPRVRALLRWATGLAEAAAGRKSAGVRDLLRARRSFLGLDDVASAAAVTLDYECLTGRSQSPLFLEVIEQAPADARPEIITRIEAMAAGRAEPSQHTALKSLAMTSNVQRRWSQ
jgi:tetratricopeptide (TPR) repeat protein